MFTCLWFNFLTVLTEEKPLPCDVRMLQVHHEVVGVFYEEQCGITIGLRTYPLKTELTPVIQKTGNKGFCAHKYSLISGISINLTARQLKNTNTIINLPKEQHVNQKDTAFVYCLYCKLFR